MIKNLIDIAPIPDEEITEIFGDAIPSETVGGASPALIVGALLAALIALGICFMIVRQVRKKRENVVSERI
jgi:hypothetical protein